MDNTENLREIIRDLIVKNKTEKAFEILAKKQLSQLDRQLIILNNRFNKVKDEKRMGIVSNEEAGRELAKINLALIDLSSKIGTDGNLITQTQSISNNNLKYIIPIILALGIGGYFIYNNMQESDATVPTESPEDLVWAKAVEEETLITINDYLAQYPNGKHAVEAKNMIIDIEKREVQLKEESDWKKALDLNTLKSFQSFLTNYPEGQFVSDAEFRINNLKLEDKIWNTTLDVNTLEEYESYLSLFENGRYSEMARQKIKEIGEDSVWKRAQDNNEETFYEDYITAFPDGKYYQSARKKLSELRSIKERALQDAIDFKQASQKNTIKGYEVYIQKHPSGQFINIARQNMKAIEASKKCGCAPKTFRAKNGATWAEFRMPKAVAGMTVNIPEGVHNKYVFPKCNRVWWTNLTFTCNPNSCNWERISGTWDSDALCHGGRTPHKYLFVGDF
ncbi:MAG: hypothetical protein NXI23_00200 [Bacteroidetes bacterium]|jgi:hypothetical protein|nr:hypothetical protein [Bacteroidota bacterium]MDF1864937.1 hypothetical protein [Saprospiraceae bacterium]